MGGRREKLKRLTGFIDNVEAGFIPARKGLWPFSLKLLFALPLTFELSALSFASVALSLELSALSSYIIPTKMLVNTLKYYILSHQKIDSGLRYIVLFLNRPCSSEAHTSKQI